MLISSDQAKNLLIRGKVVALPTETVYGLAARIDNEQAIKKIFQLKSRPFFDPLIVHVCDIPMAKKLCTKWGEVETYLAQKFWPGPLTLVLEKNDLINDLITASLPKVGLRSPAHPVMLSLIKDLNVPLAAPSANKFKAVSPTKAQHVEDEFDGRVAIVDGGECQVGIESTVLEIIYENDLPKNIFIYRPGMISLEAIQASLESSPWKNITVTYHQSPVAPGQLEEHYRPNKPLTIQLIDHAENFKPSKGQAILTLPDEPELAARQLYAVLRSHQHDPSVKELILLLKKTLWTDESWHPLRERLTKAASKIVDY